jgi:hypothetical protein
MVLIITVPTRKVGKGPVVSAMFKLCSEFMSIQPFFPKFMYSHHHGIGKKFSYKIIKGVAVRG